MARVNAPKWPVMHAVLAQGQLAPTHERLAEVAGVDKRSVSNVIREAGSESLLTGGRPARLGPGLGVALGLSLGAESLRGVLVDANGETHHPCEDPPTPVQLEGPPELLLDRLRAMAERVLRAGLEDEALWVGRERQVLRLLGVSVAWPCPIDRTKRPKGQILRAGQWRKRKATGQVPTLPERTAEALGAPFTADRCHALNDVSAHALSVAFDEARSRAGEPDEDRWRVALVVRVGGGLGAATIMLAPHSNRRLAFIDSRLIEGSNGLAGELGHLPIGRRLIEDLNRAAPDDQLAPMQYDTWECSCRRLHHLEAFASGRGLVRRLQASGYTISEEDRRRAGMLRESLAEEADDLQIHAVKDAGRILGRALAGPILMLDPHSITVTGSLANRHLLDGIRRERDIWANAIDDSVELRSMNDPYAGARGAALAVMRRAVYRGFIDGRSDHLSTFRFDERDLEHIASRAIERHN